MTSPPRSSAPPCAWPPPRSSSSSSPASRERPASIPGCTWLRLFAAAIGVALAGCATKAIAFLDRRRNSGSYALRRGAGGKRIEWVDRGRHDVLRAEPTPFGSPGLKPRLASFFVSEELL